MCLGVARRFCSLFLSMLRHTHTHRHIVEYVAVFWGFRPWQAGEPHKSLGTKDQSCPMLRLSHKAIW